MVKGRGRQSGDARIDRQQRGEIAKFLAAIKWPAGNDATAGVMDALMGTEL
jgi:hypothetical protein